MDVRIRSLAVEVGPDPLGRRLEPFVEPSYVAWATTGAAS
jgi:hypothetical protein